MMNVWNFRPRQGAIFALVFLHACTLAGPLSAAEPMPDSPARSLKICVATDADPEIQTAAQAVLAAVATQPMLSAMSKESAPRELTDTKALLNGPVGDRAYSHLVVIGLATDPLIQTLSQRESRLEDGGIYVYGWGHLRGDIGYIESARNPFLHSADIPSIPFETEVVTLTGTTPKGVQAAVDSFLKHGVFNGVVGAPGWSRGKANLLSRDPLSPDAGPPAWIPATAGAMKSIGVISGSEDEYRGVLENAGAEPLEIWRVKYLGDTTWDVAGDFRSCGAVLFESGLHRRASGNSLWLARFASPDEAVASMKKIAAANHFVEKDNVWYGTRPGFSKGPSFGPIALWQHGDWLLMSTLPAEETGELSAALK
jgi:hypothetical protein